MKTKPQTILDMSGLAADALCKKIGDEDAFICSIAIIMDIASRLHMDGNEIMLMVGAAIRINAENAAKEQP